MSPYHGPSQLVMYLIFDLDAFYHDIHLLLRELEQVVIDLMHHYGLQGERMKVLRVFGRKKEGEGW